MKDWTSINPTIVWSQQIQGRGAQWYWVDLAGQLPPGTREAAFSVYLETGSIACDQLKSVQVTGNGANGAVSRLLLLHTYYQNSWSFQTSTIDLPVHSRGITISHDTMCPSADGGTTAVAVYLTGYR